MDVDKLSERELDRLFMAGDRDLHKGNINAAIETFEELLSILEPSHNLYFNVQRNLVKAYQKNEQGERAIALCQLLIDSDNNTASLWGTKFMANLVPSEDLPQVAKVISEENEEAKSTENLKPAKIKFKTLSEFKQYCQKHLLPELKQLEQKRIRTLATIVISGIICAIAALGFCQLVFVFLKIDANVLWFSLVCWGLIIPIWILFCRSCIKIYGLGFKRNIIEQIINFIDDNNTLNYANHLLLEDKRPTIVGFTRSQIFRDELEEPDSLEQEDCVYGTIGNTDIFFAEIIVENLKVGYLNEFEQAEYRGRSLLFRGLFFEAKFSKHFVSRTFILPNNIKYKVGAFNNWRGENIDLEDPEFKHFFQVYGDNQVESRYILSTSLMSRLVDFRRKAKRQVFLSFIQGFVYIAIPYRYNLFEPKLLQTMTSFAPLREYFTDLQLAIGIVDDLNLNRRIWKQ